MNYSKLTKCRVCGNTNLLPVVTLGDQYTSAIFPADLDYRKTEQKYPLNLVMCQKTDESCGTVQLDHEFDLTQMYKVYPYSSKTNTAMIAILKNVADAGVRLVDLKEDDLILDIAGNDCLLVSNFEKYNCNMMVIDAASMEPVFAHPKLKNIQGTYFSKDVFEKHSDGKKAKLIYCIAAFYHINNPIQFLKDAEECLDENGVFIIQMAYLLPMLSKNMIDNIVVEHAAYYSFNNLEWMTKGTNLEIFHGEENDVYSGSMRVFLKKRGSKNYPVTDTYTKLLDKELSYGVFNKSIYSDFEMRMKKNKDDLVKLLTRLKKDGKRVMVYGACHDIKTHLVTESGIKNIEDVLLTDQVYTLNLETSNMELAQIDEIFQYDYDGDMINFYGKRINQMVTPNHNILYQTSTKQYKFESAEIMYEKSGFLLPQSSWDGINNEKIFYLSKFVNQDLFSNKCRKIPNMFNTADFLYLLGVFVGDGYTCDRDHGFSINLCIPREDKARKRLQDTLERMGLQYREYDAEIQIASKALYLICLTCGKGALNKRVPQWALEYSQQYLEFLLQGLVDSDGWYEPKGRRKFCSSSMGLIKDVVEICLKLGYFPSISTRKDNTTTINEIRGIRVIASNPGYIVNICSTQPRCYNQRKVKYTGKVWCLSVKNKNFLVEREGKISFSGNSTKGNTILQYYGIGTDLIEAAADVAPWKIGKLMIGSDIPIISQEEMRQRKPDYLLSLAYSFTDHFIKQEHELIKYGTRFIVPLPSVKILKDENQQFTFTNWIRLAGDESRFVQDVAEICDRIDFVPKYICQIGAANSGELEYMGFIEKGSKAIMFEPHPEFYKELVTKWGHIPNISIYELGIYNKVGKFKFYEKWASTCLEECLETPRLFTDIEREAIKKENKHFYANCALFSGFDEGNIDLLFIDSNGAEFHCLQELKSRPLLIVVETHYIFTGYQNPFLKQIYAWMELNNYLVCAVNESDSIFVKKDSLLKDSL